MTQKYTKMNAIKLKSFLILIGLCTYASSRAQSYLGLQQSNYGGIHQSNLNPANITNGVHKTYFNALNLGFGFNNDYVKLNMPFSVMQLITGNVPSQYKNPTTGKVDFQDEWLKEDVNGKPKNVNLYMQIRTPGFMVQLPLGIAVGLQYKNNISFQINNVAEPLARLAKYGVDSSDGTTLYSGPNKYVVGQNFRDNAFTINVNAYGELAGTVAKTIIKNENMVIKAGFTGKYLMGYATGYIKNQGMQFRVQGMDTIVFNETNVEYGYTDLSVFNNLSAVNIDLLTKKLQGSGFGYDIGGTVEIMPKSTRDITNKKTKYLFRVGASLLDCGSIHYKNNLKTTTITNSGDKNFYLNGAFAEAWSESTDRGIQYTDSVLRTILTIDSARKDVKTTMPTTLNLQFDYNVFKNLFIGANISQDLRGKDKIGVRKASYVMIIPRFESKLFEIAIPFGLMNDYRTGRIGFFARIGPVFVGSDNLIGQLKSNNFYGADFYVGLSMGITGKKDKDGDSDKSQQNNASE
ncbi:MAG: DUF5723 family protein [Bacteroidota bacterium]